MHILCCNIDCRFMSQTATTISLRSPLPNQDFNPFSSAMLKFFFTAGRACNSSRQTLQGVIAFTGLSTFSSIVTRTLTIIARIRSDVSNASLLKTSLALLRASLNLSFASDNNSLLDSFKSISGKLESLFARNMYSYFLYLVGTFALGFSATDGMQAQEKSRTQFTSGSAGLASDWPRKQYVCSSVGIAVFMQKEKRISNVLARIEAL